MRTRSYCLFISLLLLLWPGDAALAQQRADDFQLWQQHHISRIAPTEVRHADLKKYLDELRSYGLQVREVGRSVGGREIYEMEFGRGPFKVFLWSQMHGDEPTATSALIDLYAFLLRNRDLPLVKAIEARLTLRAVPMLNPDGAELFQRRNLQHIDINRDARRLATPEGRLLKRLRDEWKPDLGFNLHNQNTRTAVGDTGKQATISLLAVPYDEYGNDNPGRILSKRVCAVIHEALAPAIYGQIARYDDSFNPRAFGDLVSKWGTPVVLIETGGWHGHSEMELVQLNFVALVATLRSLADESIKKANPAVYDSLKYNAGGRIYDLIIRNVTIINSGAQGPAAPFKADIGINTERARRQEPRSQIQEVGDLASHTGLETFDGANFVVTVAGGQARPGAEAVLYFYERRRAEKIDWRSADLVKRYPPDRIYRAGGWVSGN